MPKIFISYRREDSRDLAARIHEKLSDRFGRDSIFFDVDSIPAAVDFVTYIRECIEDTGVMVVVIGKKWASAKFDSGPKAGMRRIEDPDDYLRIELETAISNKKPFLPVLVDGAAMPTKEDIPPSLRTICTWNGTQVFSGRNFAHTVAGLVRDLDKLLQTPYETKKEFAIKELTKKISLRGEFNADFWKSAAGMLQNGDESEGLAFLAQVELFCSDLMPEAQFVTLMKAEQDRRAKAEIKRKEEAKQKQKEQEELKRKQTEVEQHAKEFADLKSRTELERKERDQRENKLQMAIEQERKTREEKLSELQKGLEQQSFEKEAFKRELERLAAKVARTTPLPTISFFRRLFESRTVNRPADIEGKLGLSLFMSMPRFVLNKGLRSEGTKKSHSVGAHSLESVIPSHVTPFLGALRDRLIMFFEKKNLTHKPKLVAITSCGRFAGATTVANGLAASVSDTGEGYVLLVDLNIEGGAAHSFHRGQMEYGLNDALDMEKRGNMQVQDNLYVATEIADKDQNPQILQRRFSSLISQIKASDYDYIIFDMPPINGISPTPRLARLMDIVLIVVESEKTECDTIKRATKVLKDANAPDIGIVLNKVRNLRADEY